MERDARAEILVALEAAGRPEAASAPLTVLAELIARWARAANLSAHRTAAAVARHLIADAIALSTVLPAHRNAVDLGSGAGLPAFPLAVLDAAARYTIVESRERPHHFQREVVRVLGVENVEVLRGRAEALPASPHDLAIAQAMGAPDAVLPLLARWLAVGGHAAIPYSQQPPAVTVPSGLPVRVLAARQYRVATTGVTRSLWLAVRDGDSPPSGR